MTARLPSLTELDRRVTGVEREASDLRGLVMHVGERTQDTRAAVKSLDEDFTAFYEQWKGSGLASFAKEWKDFCKESKDEREAAAKEREEATAFREASALEVAEARKATARESAINHEQDARLARYEAAAAQLSKGAERAENAAPAFEGAMDKLDKLAIPPRNASLRQWGTFAIAAGIALWEILKTAGVIK